MSIDQTNPQDGSRQPEWNTPDLYLLGATAPAYEGFGALARAWLEELPRVVPDTYGRKVAGEFDFPPAGEPDEYRKPVRLDNGQVVEVWLNRYLDDPRGDGRCFRRVEVRAYSSRTDTATLASLAVLEGAGAGEKGVERIARWLRGRGVASIGEWVDIPHPDGTGTTTRVPADPDALPTTEDTRLLAFARALLAKHRPDLDQRSEEGVEMLVGTCSHVKDAAESARKLAAFLEFGAAGRRTRRAVEDPELDSYAAQLHHIAGMSAREIAEKWRRDPTDTDIRQGGHATVQSMIARGTDLLKQAVGAGRWPDYVRLLRAEYERSAHRDSKNLESL